MKRKLLVIVMMGICGFPIAKAQTSSSAGQQDNDTLNVGTVTVTALGTSANVRKVGYTVSQVQGKGLVSSGESGVIQALTGKASNVQITKTLVIRALVLTFKSVDKTQSREVHNH